MDIAAKFSSKNILTLVSALFSTPLKIVISKNNVPFDQGRFFFLAFFFPTFFKAGSIGAFLS